MNRQILIVLLFLVFSGCGRQKVSVAKYIEPQNEVRRIKIQRIYFPDQGCREYLIDADTGERLSNKKLCTNTQLDNNLVYNINHKKIVNN